MTKGHKQTSSGGSARSHAGKALGKEHTAKNKEHKQERQLSYHQQCIEIVASWEQRLLPKLKHSSASVLPIDVWTKILKCLCDGLDDVRGPSVVARDISNAASVNKELYAASLPAFQKLSTLCGPFNLDTNGNYQTSRSWHVADDPPSTALWERFVSDPTSLNLAELRQIYIQVNLHTDKPTAGVRQPKAVLVIEIMKRIHLAQPSPLPAGLILAVEKERNEIHPKLVIGCAKIAELDYYQNCKQDLKEGWFFDSKYGSFQLREDCIKHGIQTMAALKEASQRKKTHKKQRLMGQH